MPRLHALSMAGLGRWCVATALSVSGGWSSAQPQCAYTLRYDPSRSPALIEVTMAASGLSRHDGPWSLVLDGWGGWPDLDRPYFVVTSADPPLSAQTGQSRAFLIPQDWDGTLRVTYTIPVLTIGADEQRASTILPAADHRYLACATANTIAEIRGSSPAGLARTITFDTPPGSGPFTGWAGDATGRTNLELPPPGDNAIYAIGVPLDVRRAQSDGVAIEVFQFAPGDRAAEKTLEVAAAFVAHAASTLRAPPPRPVRICISGTTGGGYLTDHGLVVGLPPGSPEWLLDSPYFRHLICHELFHTWLGGVLREAEPERTVWFKEGFTDYLSLWHGAASGVLPREWFADRMLEIERDAAGSAFGSAPFIGEHEPWRDGDGPRETMAYKGGAVLALSLDAALRRHGHRGLAVMLREMIADGEARYSDETILVRLRRIGLADFVSRHITGAEAPTVRDALLSLGYEWREFPTELAYVGLRTEDGEGFGRVVEIDPAGPAAAAGFRLGDVIGGLAPARTDDVRVGDAFSTPFSFGLTIVEPTDDPVTIWVHRTGEDPAALRVIPRRVPGGAVRRLTLTPEAEAAFFKTGG